MRRRLYKNNRLPGTFPALLSFSKSYFNKIGHFFLITPYEQDLALKAEDDHSLLWLPMDEAHPLMCHDIYRWALEEAVRRR